MKKGSSRDGGKKSGLTLADFRLWRDFVHDTKPYDDINWEALEKEISETSPGTQIIKGLPRPPVPAYVPPEKPKTVSKQEPQLDASTERKIFSGKMPIEGTLDLHGYHQEDAHRLLNEFTLRSHGQGKRLLLVITGKGKGSAGGAWYDIPEGVLKQKVPLWLSVPPLKEIVLKVFPAHQRDGGSGALYVYLKRERTFVI